jgi:two-component system, LytTR family, response regulator LytT
MKIVIVEDEAAAARRLHKLILDVEPDAEILALLDSVENTVSWCTKNEEPDLFFMDIQLADGLSFEIVEQVSIKAPIIFTTAFDEYAIKAFTVNSIDYLLKPIEPATLERAINKYRSMARPEKDENLQQILKDLLQGKSKYRERFLVKRGDAFYPLLISEVAYFYAEDKVVFAKTKAGQRVLLDFTLDTLESTLNPLLFFRANRQYLISIDAVIQLSSSFNGKLKVSVNPAAADEIIISREKALSFKNWVGKN